MVFACFLAIFFQTVDDFLLICVIGLSALAERPMDSRSCVRACVMAYLENRASDFDDFLH